MDRALASTAKPEAIVLACDGFLMIREDRLKLARARLSECVEIARPDKSDDDVYVVKFCRLWLAIYDESVGFEAIKLSAEEQNLAWLKASKLVQLYLPRSPIEPLERICGHRTSNIIDRGRRTSTVSLINTKISSQPASHSAKITFDL